MSTNPAEGDQFAHPDSPFAREQRRQEEEDAQVRSIHINRRMAHDHLRQVGANLRLMDRAVARLREDDLYDVDFVDGNAETIYATARAQIDVALAALTTAVPTPEQS